jgi:phosphoenolpyruvate-protein phosphotransferase (PTS system enzyme I)
MERMEGKSLSTGLARGVAVVIGYELQRTIEFSKPVDSDSISRTEVFAECERMDDALQKSKQDLHELHTLAGSKTSISAAIELVSAHAAMASDIASLVKERVSKSLVGVEEALDAILQQSIGRLTKMDNTYFREREMDIRDVGQRMMRHLLGVPSTSHANLPPGSIIVARELVPSDAIALANSGVIGIVTQYGGKLGHMAIIARSLGIPAISGISKLNQRISSGMTLLIDGEAGVVTTEPNKKQITDFDARIFDTRQLPVEVDTTEEGQCQTLDGTIINLFGNVGLQTDVAQVMARRLAGVGLFRTEFLYLQSKDRPDIESQRQIYADTAQQLCDRPLVIRTFDLGGDKLPPFLSLDREVNPASLNLRGLRFSLVEKHLLRMQLTAIVQVAQEADVRVLFPMVISGDDFSQGIAVVERAMADCGAIRRPQIGAMIETPAALFCLDEILAVADFITIGTNDLTHYLLATDRELTSECTDVTAMHPAVLRAIQRIVIAAERWDCRVCVCGEEVCEPEFAELLVGMGIRDFSVSPSRASGVRVAISNMDLAFASELATRAIDCRRTKELQTLWLPPNQEHVGLRPIDRSYRVDDECLALSQVSRQSDAGSIDPPN